MWQHLLLVIVGHWSDLPLLPHCDTDPMSGCSLFSPVNVIIWSSKWLTSKENTIWPRKIFTHLCNLYYFHNQILTSTSFLLGLSWYSPPFWPMFYDPSLVILLVFHGVIVIIVPHRKPPIYPPYITSGLSKIIINIADRLNCFPVCSFWHSSWRKSTINPENTTVYRSRLDKWWVWSQNKIILTEA